MSEEQGLKPIDVDQAITDLMADLASLRRGLGCPQDVLAWRIGVTQATLSRWETGVRQPSLVDILRYARAVGADLVLGSIEVST